MAKLHKLTARMVALASKPGRLSDGGNLYLAISRSGAKSWAFLYEKGGRQREAGLGSAAAVTLAEARVKASELRKMLASGVDPLDAQQLPTSVVPTFGEVAANLIASKRSGWRSLKHQRQWQTPRDVRSGRLKPLIRPLTRSSHMPWLMPAGLPGTACRRGLKSPFCAANLPAMIGLVVHVNHGPTVIHRIFISEDGSGKVAVEPDNTNSR